MSEGADWTCPHCGLPYVGAPDAEGMLTCPSGHRAYSGYVAEAAALRARLGWLGDRVEGGEPRPDQATARRYGVWPSTQPPGVSASTGAGGVVVGGPAGGGAGGPTAEPYVPRAHQPVGAQVLLLGLGAALLIIAAIVFTAVVWDQLGAIGKVGVMGLATLGCGALAVRLRPRLPGTAEALAVVAYGLAVVDVVAAPALGLVPDEWVYPDRLYLAGLAAAAGALFAWLGRRASLRAWSWLGWATVALAAGLLTWWLMVGPLEDQPGRAVSLSVLTLSAVALLAAPYTVAWLAADRGPLRLAALAAAVLAGFTLPAALYDLDRPAFLGTAVTLLLTAGAVLALVGPTGTRAWVYVSAVLGGAAAGLVLLLLPDTEAVWPAVVAAAAGVVLMAGLARRGLPTVGLVVSAVAWATWGLGRLAVVGPESSADPVYLQLAVVLAVGAACWWAVAWRGHAVVLAWPAAVVAELAWVCVLPRLSGLPDVPESTWLPFGAFLLLGGWVWHRRSEGRSLAWLAPGVAVALLPSAVACWAAPWVYPFSDESTAEALIRLLAVVGAALLVVLAGVRLRLAGLLVPGAVALAVVGAAQLWGGAQAMPRWIAIAIAGTVLIVLGARIEWLRRGGREVRTFLESLG